MRLKVLESAQLVGVEPQGNRRLYSIKRDGLEELRHYLDRFWSDVLSDNDGNLIERNKLQPTCRSRCRRYLHAIDQNQGVIGFCATQEQTGL